MPVTLAITWEVTPREGAIKVENGRLMGVAFTAGKGKFQAQDTWSRASEPSRMELEIAAENLGVGKRPTVVRICCGKQSFSFFLRDVTASYPILLADFSAAVTTADDRRSYQEIFQVVRSKGLLSALQRIELEPEETYEHAAAQARELIHPIWMGISRDVRIFELGLREPMAYCDWIQPRWHGQGYFWPEKEYTAERYGFVAGRGWTCGEPTHRYLDEGVLPIFHAERIDDDIRYEQTAFVTLEQTPLSAAGIRGTHALVADGLSVMHSFNEQQEKAYQAIKQQELQQPEETVLCCRIKAVNTGCVPRYTFFKALHPLARFGNPGEQQFDGGTGFGRHKDAGLVFGISKLNGRPMPQEEIAVLAEPGETVIYEFMLLHSPIPESRARQLAQRDMEQMLQECRTFWKTKLAGAATLSLPEKRIDEMVRACLLHVDLTTYGHEPDGLLNATNGTYSMLGSETVRNIQYYDSVGWHAEARRCLDYFLDKQHDDGLLQNFGGYMLENGAILWCLGEHYRYTRDDAWLEGIEPKLRKACDYILRWRQRNKKEELRGKGYGLLDGKVADPEDPERTFMLNGYAYLGLKRAAELFAKKDPAYSRELEREAADFHADILAAYYTAQAQGPVVPLGDGTWCPTVAPWVGPTAPVCLFMDGKNWWTHGSMMTRDDMLGAFHLAYQEVFEPHDPAVTIMLNSHGELMRSRNVTLSQPYYSPHPIVHLRRGEAKAFLKSYYNTFAALSDREIYSFWEHFYHESPHKTSEEGHFLLQTRLMLYLEDGGTLRLLTGIPRVWLADGQRLELKKVVSYFGPLSLTVNARLHEGFIEAELTCHDTSRRPQHAVIRLPHPTGQKALSVTGGSYDAGSESILVSGFSGTVKVKAFF